MEPTHFSRANSDLWQTVATEYNRTVESIDEDVVVLQKWLKTQPHLPDLLDSHSLRNFLLLNKFSIEVTKQKVEKFYTISKKYEEIYGKCNPRLEFNEEFCKVVYMVPFPKLTPEKYRIVYFKGRKESLPDSFEPADFIKRIMSMQIVGLKEDVLVGDIIIGDLQSFSLSIMPKMTPLFIYRSFMIYEKIYSVRMKGMYLINLPPFAATVITLIKKIMKPKLANRIHVLKDSESIKELLSLDLIPTDFGGNGPSLNELQEALNASHRKHADLFDRLDEVEIDESLKPKLENEDVFGLYGNFKKLNFD